MDDTEQFIFTPDNLLDNLDKLGAWSSYGLAEEAIYHYFPHVKRIRDTARQIQEMCRISEVMGNYQWQDWIKKYQKEVGYKRPTGFFDEGAVNQY
jgi:3-phenylpropionate/cinnamic acid dioxygenase small subunit